MEIDSYQQFLAMMEQPTANFQFIRVTIKELFSVTDADMKPSAITAYSSTTFSSLKGNKIAWK